MEKLLYFFVHLGIPLLILWAVLRSHPKSKMNFLLGKIFQFSCLIFLYQWGQYPLVGSYYMRYFILVLAVVTIVITWRKWHSDLSIFPKGWKSYVLSVLLIITTPLLINMDIKAFNGLSGEPDTVVSLSFPLKKGTSYLSSGGTTAIINNHFRNYPNDQQFAIDINQVNKLGSASSNIFSSVSDKHVIFSREIYCPCTGEVIDVRNNVQDNIHSSVKVNHDFGRGNYIDLDCDGLIISMSHLKFGSIQVNTGDMVIRDQLLGEVGNTGFSQEPHLHIQAAQYNKNSVLVSVPVKFDNRWLVRNTLVK